MGGKSAATVVHEGTQSVWNGIVTTVCGLEFAEENQEQATWFVPVSCPDCLTKRRK